MNEKIFLNKIKERLDQDLLKKAIEFPRNLINIIKFERNPLEIRTIILDNEREYHLIIDESKSEIFHDCPTFLIYSDLKDKFCIHIISLLVNIDPIISERILSNIDKYNLVSEDFGGKKKSESFLQLADSCFMARNWIEGLNYLNKALINKNESNHVVKQYLNLSIQNDLFIEFFEFLQNCFNIGLEKLFEKYSTKIITGFKKFLKSVKLYSFFDILLIIEIIDNLLSEKQFKELFLRNDVIEKISKMVQSKNFNEKYFSYYILNKLLEENIIVLSNLEKIFANSNYDYFKNEIVEYFIEEIENFTVIDKLNLMKKHFEIFKIPKDKYIGFYKQYDGELKDIQRKLYLKKFAFLKLIMEKNKIIKSKVNFRKKRNYYTITHDKRNVENPAYKYILQHIGFFGINDSNIKSSDLGINFFIIKELFSDDFTRFPDIFYYKKQFWGDESEYSINLIDGFNLLRKPINYHYNLVENFSEINDIIIIEWDLANKPLQGSIVNAYGSQIIIPDQNTPLFYDLKPFDLCFCRKTPVKIERNIIKTLNVLTKCSFKDAIKGIENGLSFIEGYYPLSLVKKVIERKINVFEAYSMVINNPNRSFIPDYQDFIKAFQEFLFKFIQSKKAHVLSQIKSDLSHYTKQILTLFGLDFELSGMDLPYTDILRDVLRDDLPFNKFKVLFLAKVNEYIRGLLKSGVLGSTNRFDVKKMKHTSFVKYIKEILEIRKREFENCPVKILNKEGKQIIDISKISQTYYGQKILNIMAITNDKFLTLKDFNKFKSISKKLGLKLKFMDKN
ncbi:MAG: hypothetical protein ACTSSM_06775 [Promethearchaeota archaeon]